MPRFCCAFFRLYSVNQHIQSVPRACSEATLSWEAHSSSAVENGSLLNFTLPRSSAVLKEDCLIAHIQSWLRSAIHPTNGLASCDKTDGLIAMHGFLPPTSGRIQTLIQHRPLNRCSCPHLSDILEVRLGRPSPGYQAPRSWFREPSKCRP